MRKIFDFFSTKLRATAVAGKVAAQLQAHQPAAGWHAELAGATPRLSIGNRIIAIFEDTREGVAARILEPGQPGDDDPPVTLQFIYEVTNFAYRLEGKASLLDKLSVYGLRPNAVYQVIREFHDFHHNHFPLGARLTFVGRSFVPYHGGHTVQFAEALMYLQEDDEVCRRFEEYVAVAGVQ